MDVTSTAAETARQTAVDKAAAVANAASYSSAQAWTLGSIAAKWQAVDPVQASVVFSDAVQASLAKAANATGYWGQEQAVRDNAAAWPETTKDLAAYNAQRVAAFAGKAWELRAVAAEWVGIDKAKAQHLLEQALSQSQKNSDTYLRELDVRAIAVVWAGIDKAGAESLLGTITDPMLRAWGLREIGDTDKAVEAARQIGDAYDRAWSLREIARAAAPASAAAIFAQAQEAAGKVEDATARAYALADLAGAWAKIDAAKGLDIASKIDAANVQAQTVALHAVASASGNKDAYIKALDAASRLGKAYTISKYTANIATDYAAVDANAALDVVGKIGDSFLRDLAYRDIARALAAKDPAATKASPPRSAAWECESRPWPPPAPSRRPPPWWTRWKTRPRCATLASPWPSRSGRRHGPAGQDRRQRRPLGSGNGRSHGHQRQGAIGGGLRPGRPRGQACPDDGRTLCRGAGPGGSGRSLCPAEQE